MTHEDASWFEYLHAAREHEALEYLGPVCAGCGSHCGHKVHEVGPDEVYCHDCALGLIMPVKS